MAVLYVTSLPGNAGKTMISAGLGRYWLNRGRKVGYLKLLIRGSLTAPSGVDNDALFVKNIFNLPGPAEALSMVIDIQGEGLKQGYEAISRDKDIVIVEGPALIDSIKIVEALDAKVLLVHDYALPLTPNLLDYQKMGHYLIGLILNKVPRQKMESSRDRVNKEAAIASIRVLGLIPENRMLMAPSIAELSEALQGRILNNPEKAGELIENFMMGSSTFDRGAAYYNRKNNKAVLLWGDRPGYRKAAIANLQSAALQTSTRCLVISANSEPIPIVSQKAAEKQVPVISAPGSLPTLISAIENHMGSLKFRQEKKLPELEETLLQNLNLQQISEELDLAG